MKIHATLILVLLLLVSCVLVPGNFGITASTSLNSKTIQSGDHPGGNPDGTLSPLRGMIELFSVDRRNIQRFYDAPMSPLASEK
ncbi:MAG TPA: hypothetical protein EYO84_06400, partial [Planctomycetes bacterium]|nr:hypothetical protein [Planctomycetota bacterium]